MAVLGAVFLAFGIGAVGIAMALRCYSCGGLDQLSCEAFQTDNDVFVKACPPSSKSCSIQSYEYGKVVRSCEIPQLKDCQTANKVSYCYCASSLCNGNGRRSFSSPVDDEDLEEDEGSGATKPPSNYPNVIQHKSNAIRPTNTANCCLPKQTQFTILFFLWFIIFR